jgi:polar amino acid transport system substrate-binding protein
MGTLIVATEAQYAPNEFIAPDGHTVIGMDADMMQALGEVMGLKVKLINSNFETIIPGLAAGRYDVGASSFTDTKEREKTSTSSTTSAPASPSTPRAPPTPASRTMADLCGKTVAVEKGTTEQEQAEAQSKTCAKGSRSR